MDNKENKLFLNTYIVIAQWFDEKELYRIQTVSKLFYDQAIPIVFNRNKIFANVFHGFLHFFESSTKNLKLYDPISKKHIVHQINQVVTKYPRSIAIDRKNVILAGGEDNETGQSCKKTWLINMTHTSATQTAKKDMHVARYNFGIAYDDVKKEVYAIGGFDSEDQELVEVESGAPGKFQNYFLDMCEKYSVEKDEWTCLPSMASKRQCPSACFVDKQFIFVIGGHNDDENYQNVIEKFSIELNSWMTIQIKGGPEKPCAGLSMTYQVGPSCIIIAGGTQGGEKDAFLLDTANLDNDNTLQRIEDLPQNNCFFSPSHLIINNQLYVLSLEQNILKYSIDSKTWEKVNEFTEDN